MKKLWENTEKLRTFLKKYLPAVLVLSLIGNCFQGYNTCLQHKAFKTAEEEREKAKKGQMFFEVRQSQFVDIPELYISNIGDKRLDSIWISVKYFLVNNNAVYECDLPRFNYISYKGSRRVMFYLANGADTSISIYNKCFKYFKEILYKSFSGTLVCRWMIEYCQVNSPQRESIFKYYILNDLDSFIEPSDITGGYGMVETIDQFEKYGSNKLLEYDNDFGEYVENHPHVFYFDKQNKKHLIYPRQDKPEGVKKYVEFQWDKMHVAHKGKKFSAFVWGCADSNEIGKAFIISGPPIY